MNREQIVKILDLKNRGQHTGIVKHKTLGKVRVKMCHYLSGYWNMALIEKPGKGNSWEYLENLEEIND